MQEPSTKSAFTLVELLLVLFVIGVLGLILLPMGGPRRIVAYSSQCLNNQKYLSLGFNVWRNDHNGKFPWQISTNNGGTMESIATGKASSRFTAELGEIESILYKNPLKVFMCPADKIKCPATDAAAFSDDNVSYFVNVDSDANQTNTILLGDRLLDANGKPVPPGIFKYSKGDTVTWNPELHQGKGWFDNRGSSFGILSFVDGRAAMVRPSDLTSVFEKQSSTMSRLTVP